MNTVKQVWEDFKSHTIAHGADPHRVLEARHAFYAGASALLGLLLENTLEGDEDQGDAFMTAITNELCEYAQTPFVEDP